MKTTTKCSNSNKQRLLIIGAGMSGTKFAAEMASRSNRYHITLFSAEAYRGYNRIMLSPVLAGEKTFNDIELQSPEWYIQHGIEVKTDEPVQTINHQQQTVSTAKGDYHYDQLVIATGSNPFILPLPNSNAQGVVAFRDYDDVETMLSYARSQDKNRCIVIGAGLLGLEAANALRNHGAEVHVVHIADRILNQQLDAVAADLLQQHFEDKGIRFVLNAFSHEILVDENHCVTGLSFKDGSQIDADMIVMAVGVRPNCSLAQQSNIACNKGILVDQWMQTSAENVYALGECVEFSGELFGLVAPTYQQAMVLAEKLTTAPNETSQGFSVQPTATKLKVSGVDLFSAGDISDNPEYDYIEYGDLNQHNYKRLSVHNNRLVGAVLFGDVLEGAWLFDLITEQQDISTIRPFLIFGRAFCNSQNNLAKAS